jgi:uncharacterized phage protein (TIGR01671 family)
MNDEELDLFIRDIRFRAQMIDSSDWVYGGGVWKFQNGTALLGGDSRVQHKRRYPIIHSVKLETIGQFTGLKDKDGKPVYEGDIVKFNKWEWYRCSCYSQEEFDSKPDYYEEITFDHRGVSRSKADLERFCEVIGNVYENPELLK